MNERPDQQLLDDVLGEASPPDFRAALLGETLRLARRRRRWRQIRPTGAVLAAAILAAFFAWRYRPAIISTPPLAKAAAPRSYRLVETRPLPGNELVGTGSFPTVKIIPSTAAFGQVATAGGGFYFINDQQLLALLNPRPAVLIRTGPNSEELVFANPEDQKRVLGN